MKRASKASSTTERVAAIGRLAALAMLAIVLVVLGAGHALAGSGAPMHALAAETVSMEGNGYAPPPYAVAAAGPPGRWTRVALPHLLPRPLAIPGGTGAGATTVTWYRIHAPLMTGDRFLYLPRWKTDGQLAVYADGRLLYQSHADIDWNGWNIPLWLALDANTGVAPPSTLLLRIEHPRAGGGGISTLWIGTGAQIRWRYVVRRLLQVQLPAAVSAAFLAVGLFSLFLWFRLRGDGMYDLFFCIATASFLRTMHYYVGDETLLVPEAWFSWVTINALYWMVLIMHLFLNRLHGRISRSMDRVVPGVVVATALATAPGLVPGIDVYRIAPVTYVVLLVLGIAVGGVGMVKSMRSGSGTGKLLSAWGLGGMALGIVDWLLEVNAMSPEWLYLGPYTNIGAFLIFMYILYDRYISAHDAVTQANASLQLRLAERTQALEASHRRLREIELRQTLSDERERLMQDMHDGMGSSLVSALMVVERGCIDHDMVADVLRNCIDDLRLTIDSMEPVQADLLLLLATLRFRLGQRLEQAGITLHWQVTNLPPLDWLDPRSSLHVLRILQEGFTNIIKHAQASAITVGTRVEGTDVLVVISDNGCGFDPAGVTQGGKGMDNQRRRAAAIGARLSWDATSTGTTLVMRLPASPHVR